MSTTSRFTTLALTCVMLTLGFSSVALAGTTTTTAASSSSSGTTPERIIVSGFSEKGDYIDNGVSSVYSSGWTKVAATTTGIYLSNVNGTHKNFATYSFAPVAGQTFSVGNYDNVQRAAFRSAGFAGIEITGPGRPGGCDRVTGSFHIWDIASESNGTITRLDLTYVEHCGAGRASNFGEILINDAPVLGPLYASATRLTFPDQTPTLPYVLTNPTAQSQPVSLWQSATTVSHFIVTPASASCATSIRAHSSCTYLVRLEPPRPGNYSATVLITSNGSLLHLGLSGPAGGV
jgi:hypothetical protein